MQRSSISTNNEILDGRVVIKPIALGYRRLGCGDWGISRARVPIGFPSPTSPHPPPYALGVQTAGNFVDEYRDKTFRLVFLDADTIVKTAKLPSHFCSAGLHSFQHQTTINNFRHHGLNSSDRRCRIPLGGPCS